MDIQNILETSERITYQALVEKVNANELKSGQYYTFLYIPKMELANYDQDVSRTEDYDFKYSDSSGFQDKYYGHNYDDTPYYKCFNLTVQAVSSGRLGTIAYPSLHDYGTSHPTYGGYYNSNMYFRNTDFNKWVIYYDINNDKNKYEWASDQSTGVIFYMKDEFGNKACFDFKNFKIKVLRGYEGDTFIYEHRYLFDGWQILADMRIAYSDSIRYNIDMSVRHHNFTFLNEEAPPILCQMSVSKDKLSTEYPSGTRPRILRCFNNIIHPMYKTLSNGQKQLLFPTCNFEITSDFADYNFPIANNCITNNCQGFTLVDCYNCDNTFIYSDPYSDYGKQIVNFYKQNGVINPETNEEIIYTNTDYWNLNNTTSDIKQLLERGEFWPVLYSSLRNTVLGLE